MSRELPPIDVPDGGYHASRIGAGEQDALPPERATLDGAVFGLVAVGHHRIDLAVVDQHLIVFRVGVDVVWPGGVILEEPEAPTPKRGHVFNHIIWPSTVMEPGSKALRSARPPLP
jgi:hypothetical protein